MIAYLKINLHLVADNDNNSIGNSLNSLREILHLQIQNCSYQ